MPGAVQIISWNDDILGRKKIGGQVRSFADFCRDTVQLALVEHLLCASGRGERN